MNTYPPFLPPSAIPPPLFHFPMASIAVSHPPDHFPPPETANPQELSRPGSSGQPVIDPLVLSLCSSRLAPLNASQIDAPVSPHPQGVPPPDAGADPSSAPQVVAKSIHSILSTGEQPPPPANGQQTVWDANQAMPPLPRDPVAGPSSAPQVSPARSRTDPVLTFHSRSARLASESTTRQTRTKPITRFDASCAIISCSIPLVRSR